MRYTLFLVPLGLLLVVASGGLMGREEEQFIMTTESISVLSPHEHEVEDSLFDADHHIRALSDELIIEEDTWVTGFRVEVKNAPLPVLHHAGIIIPNTSKRICPNSLRGQEIFSVTPDMASSSIEFAEPYAVFLAKGTPLLLGALFHNPLPPFGPGEPYKDVSMSVVMDIEKDSHASGKKSLEYYRMHIEDVTCPGVVEEEVFAVPAGAEHFVKRGEERNGLHSSQYTFSRPGELAYMLSHFHPWEGGEEVSVFLNERKISTFLPTRTSLQLWSWVIPHIASPSIRVKPGDTIAITSTYSNPHPVPLVGAMGMLVFYFAPDE